MLFRNQTHPMGKKVDMFTLAFNATNQDSSDPTAFSKVMQEVRSFNYILKSILH